MREKYLDFSAGCGRGDLYPSLNMVSGGQNNSIDESTVEFLIEEARITLEKWHDKCDKCTTFICPLRSLAISTPEDALVILDNKSKTLPLSKHQT